MPLNRQLLDLPYKVHTNSELGLMLRGIKPLAIFCDGYDHYPECLVRYFRFFDRHVASGHIVKHEWVELMSFPHCRELRDLHYICYVLPGEEWRIDAMIELKSRPGPWSADREWEQGKLLGYTDWQNRVWAERFPFRPPD